MGCVCVLCATHRKRRGGCYETEKQTMLLLGRVWGTVSGPLPLRGLWGGGKSAGFGCREGRVQIPAYPTGCCVTSGV